MRLDKRCPAFHVLLIMTMSHKHDPTAKTTVRLRQHGLRATRQRIQLAHLLLGKENHHITPDDVYEQLRNSPEKLSRGTVYNTLRQFCEVGLLNEVHGRGDRLVYDTNIRQHHHFLNVETGELSDIHTDAVKLDELPELPPGYELDAVELTIRIRKSSLDSV